jgi:hypothetical protein
MLISEVRSDQLPWFGFSGVRYSIPLLANMPSALHAAAAAAPRRDIICHVWFRAVVPSKRTYPHLSSGLGR